VVTIRVSRPSTLLASFSPLNERKATEEISFGKEKKRKEKQLHLPKLRERELISELKTKTPWSESASELYRPSDLRLSAK
jgi:hypothetical protein